MTRAARSAVHPPRQERSRRTLLRILSATERLLLRRPFEEIGVQDIVRNSRTSVGSFYARFADKTALLSALYERYDEDLGARIEAWRARRPDPGPDLESACAWVAEYLVDSFRERRNLMRALAMFVRERPAVAGEGTEQRRVEQHTFLEEALLAHRERMPDPEPERAVRMAIFLAASACRERVLFGDSPHARATASADDILAYDVTRLLTGYLLCPPPPQRSA